MIKTYRQGRVSAQYGGQVITGTGTRWLGYVTAGDTITIGGATYSITDVEGNHRLSIGSPFSGDSGDDLRYVIDIQPRGEPLDAVKARAAAEVDRLAGIKRLQYITVGPGQEATYLDKLTDAKAYADAGYPVDSTPFVWVHAEAAATGATAAQVADLIIYTAGLWRSVGAQIEGARQAAKRSIATVTPEQGSDAVSAAVESFRAALAVI